MANSNKYTVLIMRDDTQVRRMRFSPFWLKFFLWFLLILAALGIAAFAAAEALSGKPVALQYTTSSTRLHQLLGVDSAGAVND